MNKLNAIKRFNERVADIRREYGETYFKELELRITKMVPKEVLKVPEKGGIAIKQGKGALESLSEDTINKLLELPTRGEYTKELTRQWREEYPLESMQRKRRPTKEELTRFDEMRQKVKDAAGDGLFTRYGEEGSGDYLKGSKGTKSYTYLSKLIDDFYEERNKVEKEYGAGIDKLISENQKALDIRG